MRDSRDNRFSERGARVANFPTREILTEPITQGHSADYKVGCPLYIMKRFILYLIRWQLSTPILAPVISLFKSGNLALGTKEDWIAASVANFIGGCIFFWVDKFIFTSYACEVWQIKERGVCDKCGKQESLWRLVWAPNYDRRSSAPVFLCMKCSKDKTDYLREKGVKIKGRNK